MDNEMEPIACHPEDFEEIVDSLRFASKKADPQVVKQLYKGVWPEISAKSEYEFQVGEEDGRYEQIMRLLPALSECKKIKLWVRGNFKGHPLLSTLSSMCIERGITMTTNYCGPSRIV